MPLTLTFFALSAGLVWGELSRPEDPRIIWLIVAGVLALFGLVSGISYLGSLAVLRRAEQAEEAEAAVAGTTSFRPPGQEHGWRLRMALVGALGAILALACGYCAYRAVRDGGVWVIATLTLPFAAFATGAIRAQIIPSSVQSRAKELMTQKWAERVGAENVMVEDEHGIEQVLSELQGAETEADGDEPLADRVETRLAGLETLRDSGEITLEEYARERRRILEEI